VAGTEVYLHAKFHLDPDPSNRLATIHQRHRQDRTDRQTDRQRSDSIGQTVLQTVAQKLLQNGTIKQTLNKITNVCVEGIDIGVQKHRAVRVRHLSE